MLVVLRTGLRNNWHSSISRRCCHKCQNRFIYDDLKHSNRILLYSSPGLNSLIKYNNSTLERTHPQYDLIRNFSVSSRLYDKEPLKPSSKVEVTVQALKKKQEEELKSVPAEAPPKQVAKKSIKQKIVDEIVHYYHGFRLLFIDMKISGGLMWRVLNGNSLSRREYRLLMRTVGDMFRLVPFSVFIIVPFMELLLPVFIKLFPGMLPSTFQTATEKDEKLKQNLKVKLEMAKFLQQTLDDMSLEHKDHNSQQAKEFSEWFHKVRNTGEHVSNDEILKFSKLFKDEITLDSLSRSQLVALCRVLEVQTLGTNNLLRFQLKMKLRTLAADDKMIQKEGVDSLSLWELQQACRARGMRALGVPESRLRTQLQDWLVLSLDEKVPPSLLLLSRALMLPETIPTGDKLKATISALPDNIVTQTKASIGEKEGKIDNKVQLEVIMEEERKIREERKEMGDEFKKSEQDKEVLLDKAPTITSDTGIKKKMPTVEEPKREKKILISKDMEALEDALDAISKEKKPMVEKVEIEELKEQMADYQEDVQDLKKTVAVLPKGEIKETKAAKRLYKKVHKMINRMDHVLNELEVKEEKRKKHLQDITSEKEELLKIEDIMAAIKQIKNVPDESRLQQISMVLSKIDDDHDGAIKIEDVLKVIEFIGKENVHLSPKQVDELVDLLEKEEILEVEDKIEKALKKEQERKEEKKPEKEISSLELESSKPTAIPKEALDKLKMPPPPPASQTSEVKPPPNSIDPKSKNDTTKQI
ncbi:PREDICTED: LETM1 and EF-hand domain-containing protein anon-60Da, mitochondrial [Nicrophorus vespilloides]|uniref:Mitochondrial proton/calcium exchanger protein n=1 Tax=Nicrophorus vespilloides TaxID=110193 RepID=A0ABM1NBV5_NICVS|nr:PREDICTED: LETM1 and EF-hand domain-containing protein anon-60Da, mitochondrial [Nicrophorus vespilloides]